MSEPAKQDAFDETARRNRPDAIGRSGAIAAAAFARAGFRDPTLVLRWAEIVGPEVARFAEPFRLSESPAGGVLTLRAEPAASVFLQHQTRSLCERINAFLGRPAVARLRFVHAALAPRPERPPIPRPPAAAPASDPVHSFGGPDPLKAALVNLARARLRPSRD
jgi:hypothetical protein